MLDEYMDWDKCECCCNFGGECRNGEVYASDDVWIPAFLMMNCPAYKGEDDED